MTLNKESLLLSPVNFPQFLDKTGGEHNALNRTNAHWLMNPLEEKMIPPGKIFSISLTVH